MEINCGDLFYGAVAVGERGQIAIPAQARAELGFNPGDKLLVMKDPHKRSLMLFKFEDIQNFLNMLSEEAAKANNSPEQEGQE